jgi:hypothetical protein
LSQKAARKSGHGDNEKNAPEGILSHRKGIKFETPIVEELFGRSAQIAVVD